MRSSVPCSSWIDSFSLVDIQVVSQKRDYYLSLACQVVFERNNRRGRPRRCLAVRVLRNHMTIGISLSRIYISGLVLERMWTTKGHSEDLVSLPYSRLRNLAFHSRP